MTRGNSMSHALSALPEKEWMTPSAALDHFVPPATAMPGVAGPGTGRVRYGYLVAGMRLLVKPATRCEVLPMAPVWPVPNGPDWLTGMLNLRSHLIPVLDLDRLFATGQARHQKPMLLVLGQGETAAGFVIEGYPQALRSLQETGVPASLPRQLAAHVPAAWLVDEALWLEFDYEGLFESLAGANTAA